MTNKTDAFKRDCRVVNMKCEYPGYTGEIMWMVVSDLTEAEIISRYPAEIKPYMPFIHMTREMFQPIIESDNNNRTYRRRSVLHEELYGYEDGIFERFHPQLVTNPFDQPDWTYLYDAMAKLPPVQEKRIRMWIFEKLSVVEIAKEEGTTWMAIKFSIECGLRNLKELLTKHTEE